MGRAAGAVVVALMIACGSAPLEEIDYPPLPNRHRNDSSATEPSPKSAILAAVDASVMREGSTSVLGIDASTRPPLDAATDAPADAGACAPEIEPNDVAGNTLAFGKTCGAIDAADVDRFVFYPRKATVVTVDATGTALFHVGDYAGAPPEHLAPGDSITVGPSNEAWYVVVVAPKPTSYVLELEEGD